MEIFERIESLSKLGNKISALKDNLEEKSECIEFSKILIKAEEYNSWFTRDNLLFAFKNIISMLKKDALTNWVQKYPEKYFEESELQIAVIMAGNIPIVGFHDFLCILISGKNFIGKLSSNDAFLLPYITNLLIEINPKFKSKICFADKLTENFNAIIATGNNNSARYFDYYYGDKPNIIRQNRNSITIINGKENTKTLQKLGLDIFTYFGLGCRNISKIMLPKNYNIQEFMNNFSQYKSIKNHQKYYNNYKYNKNLLDINNETYFDSGFMILKENNNISSPISVLHYEFYVNINDVINDIKTSKNQIQCVLSENKELETNILFGKSQQPLLHNYADNQDIIQFLGELKTI